MFFKVRSKNQIITNSSKNTNVLHNIIEDEKTMSPFYTNEKENYWKNKVNEMEEIDYYEFEMKKLSNDDDGIKHPILSFVLEEVCQHKG